MISKTIGVALVSAILSALLDGLGFKSRRLFSTLSAIIVMVGLVSSVSELLESVMKIACDTEIAEAADKATRAVGLGYVFGFTSDICNSLGESTLASLVTAVGRVEIFLLALPYFVKTIEVGVELLS
jgi:hypothetical protein